MGTASSKANKSSTFSRVSSTKQRASKRFLKHNSAIYPSSVPSSTNSEHIEHNNNSPSTVTSDSKDESTVVIIRRKDSDESLTSPTVRHSKKETKKKKKADAAVSGDDSVSTYHQTNVCYYKVENGKYLKLPTDTKHKSNDGCYIKMSNGSFRHLMVPDGAGSRHEVSYKPVKDVRQSLPPSRIGDRDREKNEEKQPQNRKVMVTMIDGGLPVVAVSKREKTGNSIKKDKAKVKENFRRNGERAMNERKRVRMEILVCVCVQGRGGRLAGLGVATSKPCSLHQQQVFVLSRSLLRGSL